MFLLEYRNNIKIIRQDYPNLLPIIILLLIAQTA